MTEVGVAHGRFQIVHYDHLKYVMAAKAKCKHLVVGITNPDPSLTKDDGADPSRSTAEANPLTYYERYRMLKVALLEQGLSADNFAVVPFPINFPDLYKHYVPLDATFFLTIYDAWGEKKLEMFKSLGLKTEVLWRKPLSEKGITSTDIRRRILSGEAWEQLVPHTVARLLEELDILKRLKDGES
jgi:nicotinamide-nucleotide adenylyltransferase